jgi:hypothetical protein
MSASASHKGSFVRHDIFKRMFKTLAACRSLVFRIMNMNHAPLTVFT